MSLEDFRRTQVRFLKGEIAAGWRFVLTAEQLAAAAGREQCLHFAQLCHDEVCRLLGLIELTGDESAVFQTSLAELQSAIHSLREPATSS